MEFIILNNNSVWDKVKSSTSIVCQQRSHKNEALTLFQQLYSHMRKNITDVEMYNIV